MPRSFESPPAGWQALEEALAPRLRLAGEGAALERFGEFFKGKSLEKGTEVVMLWNNDGPVELALRPEGGPQLAEVRPFSPWVKGIPAVKRYKPVISVARSSLTPPVASVNPYPNPHSCGAGCTLP